MTHALFHRRTTAALLFLTGLIALLALVAPQQAPAAPSCAKKVVADWYGDGRVDQIYPLHCYTDAIRSLPVDVLDYSNAKEDILRALSYAKRGKPDPGNAGGGPGGQTASGPETVPPGADPLDYGPSGANGGTGTNGDTVAAGGDLGTSGPSSVPVPLLVLGGLALLLLAAGGAGYLNRRAQARRGDDGPDEPLG